MNVTVRLFASVREAAGFEANGLELGAGATVADAVESLKSRLPDDAARIIQSAAFAVNQRFTRPDHKLADGDELAVLPPVSGG